MVSETRKKDLQMYGPITDDVFEAFEGHNLLEFMTFVVFDYARRLPVEIPADLADKLRAGDFEAAHIIAEQWQDDRDEITFQADERGEPDEVVIRYSSIAALADAIMQIKPTGVSESDFFYFLNRLEMFEFHPQKTVRDLLNQFITERNRK